MKRLKDVLNRLPNRFDLDINFIYSDTEEHKIRNKSSSKIVKCYKDAIVIQLIEYKSVNYARVEIGIFPHDTEEEYESGILDYMETFNLDKID